MEFAERAVQANLREQTAEARKIGLEKGFQQGMVKGMEEGLEKGMEKGLEKGIEEGLDKGRKSLLKSLILHKYGIDEAWVDALSDQQVDEAVIHILECDTYEALKDRLGEKEK